ncbi:MAG: toll/interleukin-1 receptor domain-containing protein [Saprospiraceae bacterium]|nr:toll/interleukin-1 receptor domain-containing protein [Saprospiraceae bacterium]
MNIFIAFAEQDREVRDKLLRQMNLVAPKLGWSIWSSKEIKAGEIWDDEIKQRLLDSELVILLLSTDFFNSAYIMGKELPVVMEKHKKGKCKVIPVLARICHWKETEFGEYAQLGDIQALPPGERPVLSKTIWDNEDQPYFEIVKGIKEALQPSISTKAKPQKQSVTSGPRVPKKITEPSDKAVSSAPEVTTKTTSAGFNRSYPMPLFPLYRVNLGKTTLTELMRLGKINTEAVNSRTGKPFEYVVINGMNFWYSNDKARGIYITYSNAMPMEWQELGFSWKLSYSGWKQLFESLGYKVIEVKPPKVVDYNGAPSFSANLHASYRMDDVLIIIEANFNYRRGTTIQDSGTLYALTINGTV